MTGFSLDAYAALLADFRGRGYDAASYLTVEADKSHLILRHDIDMSIQAALRMAAVEADFGWAATYFVLLRTEMYNPFSRAAQADLRRLGDMGHELGLHFDASLYDGDVMALDRAAAVECRMLEDMVGRQVRLISFHRPAKNLLGADHAIGGRLHTYMPRYFSEIAYCSDSRGAWHHGHPLDHGAVASGRALHLLTHPIWWHGAPEEGPLERLDAFAQERLHLLYQELAANCEAYTPPNTRVNTRQ